MNRDAYYFRRRLENRLYQQLVALYAEQSERGLTMDAMAARLGVPTPVILGMLTGQCVTLELVSDLLLAMGHEVDFTFATVEAGAAAEQAP